MVDTGSSDETKGIATAFGAQVVDVRWHDDFSEARNAALERATGGWILVLDADEAISAGDRERLGGLMERASENLSAYRLCTRNYTRKHSVVGFTSNRGEYPEEQGAGWYPARRSDCFQTTRGSGLRTRCTSWSSPVASHRHPDSGLPGGGSPLRHAGRPGCRRKDCDLSVARGQERTDAPARAASLRERAVQAAQMGRFGEALTLWKQFVRMHPESTEAYVNMGSCCWSLGRYDEAAGWAEHALKMNPSLKEARFNLAYAELLKGKGVRRWRSWSVWFSMNRTTRPLGFCCASRGCARAMAQAVKRRGWRCRHPRSGRTWARHSGKSKQSCWTPAAATLPGA